MTKDALKIDSATLEKVDKQILIAKQTIAGEILQQIYTFFRATELHEPGNRIFANILKSLHQSTVHWVQVFELDHLDLTLKGEQFFLNDRRVRPKPRNIKKLKSLTKHLKKRGVVGFKIPREMRIEDLNVFLWNLLAVAKGDSATKIGQDLRAKGLENWEIRSLNWGELKELEEADSAADVLYSQLFEFAKTMFSGPQGTPPNKVKVQLDQLLFEMNSIADDQLIQLICKKLVQVTEFSLAHVAVMSAIILHGWGKALGLPPFAVVELAGAGLAHPLTMIHAPQGMEQADSLGESRLSILFSNLLNFKEAWPLTDLQILCLLEFPLSFGSQGVYEVSGKKCYMHFFSRMLRIVTLFQRFTSPDRRRETLSSGEAIERLLTQEMGCDPTLVKLFVSWLGVYPMGSFIRLTTGEVGQVCSTNLDLSSILRPQVRLFTDAQGQPVERLGAAIDLTEINEKLGVYKQGIQQELKFKDTGLSPETFQNLMKSISLATS